MISFWEKTKVVPKAWCHCVLIALIPLESNTKVQRSLVCFWSERPKGWFLAIISIRAADRELWLWSPNGGRLVVLRTLSRQIIIIMEALFYSWMYQLWISLRIDNLKLASWDWIITKKKNNNFINSWAIPIPISTTKDVICCSYGYIYHFFDYIMLPLFVCQCQCHSSCLRTWSIRRRKRQGSS